MMSFKPIKKGSYTYKRVGKKKMDYRVLYRRNGICLDEKLLDIKNDDDAISKARRRIADCESEKKAKDLEQHLIVTKSPLMRFETIMDQVIASKKTLSTRKTCEFYLKKWALPILNKHCPFIKDFGPTGPEDFVTWFQNERPNNKMFNVRKYFLEVLNRSKKLGLLQSDVIVKIINPDPKRAPGKVYSEEEIRSLLSNARGDLTLQILMAYSMGMRRSEILKLKWERLNWLRQTIALKGEDTKIRRGREFKVNDPVWTVLKARRAIKKGEYVFPCRTNRLKPTLDNKTAWQALKQRTKIIGRFHDLRHTFLTKEVARNKHLAIDVCIYAGLSLEELERTYLHPTYEDTSYIADGQSEKLKSMISIAEFCDNSCDNSLGEPQYA